jgi:segregation and condensation protein A
MDYQVQLDVFHGPLDLLLYLVKRHELDIFDIPMARITEQYLHYLELMQKIDMEVAGEFLVVASTLMEIKSKLLLPRKEQPEGPEAKEDPRAELVRQLVEYRKCRDAATRLEAQAEWQGKHHPRLVVEKPEPLRDPSQQPIQQVEVWDLVSAFDRLLRATLTAKSRTIVFDETPQHIHVGAILAITATAPRVRFADIFTPPWTRGRLVGVFLALLELIKRKRLLAEQDGTFGELWITPGPGDGAEVEGETVLPMVPA